MRLIPRTMSTQHPDNARVPEWSRGEAIEGEDEVTEAFLAFSNYNVQEVMWDAEGKDVDTHVIRKLFSRYPEYFKKRQIGVDVFVTYRLPNPRIEGADRKVFAETLESIPNNFDIAEKFYGKNAIPVFEVILPFTTESIELIGVAKYYEKVVAGKQDVRLWDELYVRDLVGEIQPKTVEVIPLIEDKDSLMKADEIVGGYVKAIKPAYVRVFLARSDPAMNYGMLSAVLSAKVALSKLSKLSTTLNIKVFPIIGVGSLPFRGNMNPENYKNVMEEYKGVYTFTIQSAYKYDYPPDLVEKSVSDINNSPISEPVELDSDVEISLKNVADNFTVSYQAVIEPLAGVVNQVASLMPRRRARKLHIGLFGYSRSTGKVTLPRAISFTGAFYSIGIPPEIIGISSLSSMKDADVENVFSQYRFIKDDLRQASKYFNWESLDLLKDVWKIDEKVTAQIKKDAEYAENNLGIKVGEDNSYEFKKHRLLSSMFLLSVKEGENAEAKRFLYEMALVRKSLG